MSNFILEGGQHDIVQMKPVTETTHVEERYMYQCSYVLSGEWYIIVCGKLTPLSNGWPPNCLMTLVS